MSLYSSVDLERLFVAPPILYLVYNMLLMCFNNCMSYRLFSTLLKVLDNGQPKEESHVGGRVCIRSSMSCTWKNVKKSQN